jgi:hypothetical protein
MAPPSSAIGRQDVRRAAGQEVATRGNIDICYLRVDPYLVCCPLSEVSDRWWHPTSVRESGRFATSAIAAELLVGVGTVL